MRIQTFRAASIQEALQLVRESLGSDACILHTREVRRGFLSKRWIEVEASRDLSLSQRLGSEGVATGGQEEAATKLFAGRVDADRGNRQQDDSEQPLPGAQRNLLQQWDSPQAWESSPIVRRVRAELLSVGVDSILAEQLAHSARQQLDDARQADIEPMRKQVVKIIADRLKISEDSEPEAQRQHLVCLVGPTGVGKTVLLTKLATRASQQRQSEIGIVSINSWKNSSSDCLFHCADTISAQLEMVSGVEQLADALQRLQECDLVLIDTPGCSPQDDQQLGKLKEILQFCQPDEAHLVLSANTASHIARLTIEEFSEIGATHLDIAKCDEASGLGQWISVLWTSALPVHTLSYGLFQSDGLTSPQPQALAAILAGQAALSLDRFETLFPVLGSRIALNGQYR